MNESYCYDLFHRSREDINFYLEMAKKYGAESVLEVGSGTGRILLEIAKLGFLIDGLEPDRERAAYCKEEISKLPENVRRNINLIEKFSDDYKTEKKYSLIILPFRVLQLMGDVMRQEQSLRHLKSLLTPDGVLVLDILYPSPKLLVNWENSIDIPLFSKDTENSKGEFLKSSFIVRKINTLQQTFSSERAYEILGQKISYAWDTRYLTRYEAEYMLKYIGFDIVSVYGDFLMNSLDNHSNPKDIVFVARNK